MKKLRVLVLTQREMVPPDEAVTEAEILRARWKTDYFVREALLQLGHEVTFLGEDDDLLEIRRAREEIRPHVVFNMLELFANRSRFIPHILGYLELLGQPYTGCNPVGMMFSLDKALQRKILRHHRIAVPEFAAAHRGRVFRRPRRLQFPLIVKSLEEHGSRGIAQASVVTSDEKLQERIAHIHESLETGAIVEEFVEGREIYMGVIGNRRLEALPAWELTFENLTEGAPNIATYKMKWDVDYQERIGLRMGPARLEPELEARIARTCKRAYRALDQSGYCRFDLRLRPDGRVSIIESNPNPDLSCDAEFADSALAAGYPFPALVQKIITLGQGWMRRLKAEG